MGVVSSGRPQPKMHRALTPSGVRDWLPREAASKRTMEALVRDLFERWGYDEVITPSFEFEHVALQRAGEHAHPFYRVIDRDGESLALRAEITPSVARLAATRLRRAPAPLRLSYIGSVFRHDEPQAGRRREFTQAGVELIGVKGPAADAEVIALAAAVLDGVGLAAYHIDIGHVGFCAGLLDGALGAPAGGGVNRTGDTPDGCQSEERQTLHRTIKSALLRRDFVGLAEQVASAGLPESVAELLTSLDTLRGGPEVLDRAADRARQFPMARHAIEELKATYRHIAAYGLAGRVSFDLALAKDVDYYTGMVLEGYSEEVGYTLCTGGRYDRLIERFGDRRPATGVAFGVDRLLLARERRAGRRGADTDPSAPAAAASRRINEADLLVVVPEDGTGLSHVARWRSEGVRVAVELVERPIDETLTFARALGATNVVCFCSGGNAAGEAVRYPVAEDGGGSRACQGDRLPPRPERIDPATWDVALSRRKGG